METREMPGLPTPIEGFPMMKSVLKPMFCETPIRRFLKTRSLLKPMLYDFGGSHFATTDSRAVLKQVHEGVSNETLTKLEGEYDSLNRELSAKIDSKGDTRDWEGQVAWTTGALLYYLVRVERPRLVLETGVSRGVSTTILLRAMDENDRGELVSLDVLPDAGYLVDRDNPRWHFVVVDLQNPRRAFRDVVSDLGSIDLFFHDSDHSYKHQMSEYESVFPKLGRTGLFSSDDVNFSWAYLDFCVQHGLKPFFLVTTMNVVGLSSVRSTPASPRPRAQA